MARRKGLRLVALLAILTLLLGSMAGCASTEDDGDDAASEEKLKVGLVQINQQAIFFNQMNEGAQEAADELGVDLTIFNANDDAAKQNEGITNFITQGFDAIVVVAIDVEGIKPAIQEAKDAGIVIVCVDAVVEDPAVDVQVGVDNAAAGAEIGQFVADYIEENAVANKNIGVIGALNSFIQNIRKDSFVGVVEAAGATITQTVDGQNRQEAAMTASENLFTAQQDTGIMYATGEPAMVGAVAAVRSQDKGDSVVLFGWDLTAEVITGIDDGFVLGVVQQDPKTEGYEAVKACKTLVEGGSVDKLLNIPITIVTKANVDPYREIFK
ncbi:MAG: substrate-binding domain-containing protein [Coriobacteriia bacterium]|nr:substrate-binding domain-containing protein [Coriobacteriia bacterium]MBN2823143.1 substrate-binding domain-containing protein [Coriobacteriia bacterium]